MMFGVGIVCCMFVAISGQNFAACLSENDSEVAKCRQWIEERWSENDGNGNPIGEREPAGDSPCETIGLFGERPLWRW